MKKIFLIAILFFLGLAVAVFIFYSEAIFQRGNPLPYMSKMFTLNDSNQFSKVFTDEDIYLSRNGNHDELIRQIESIYEVSFTEQMGSAYFFKSYDKSLYASTEIYWRYYLVWEIKIQNNSSNGEAEVYNANGLQKQPMALSSTLIGTSNRLSEFVSLNSDFVSGYDTDECYNITSQHILENSDFRIYKYDTSCGSFLLYDNEIFPLGRWFGGYGVTDFKLADIDNDNEMELYFTFSWGSGIHRSQAGYFNPHTREIIVFDYAHWHQDMMIVADENGRLSLYQANITSMESFVEFTMEADGFIANIIFERDNGITLSFPEE